MYFFQFTGLLPFATTSAIYVTIVPIGPLPVDFTTFDSHKYSLSAATLPIAYAPSQQTCREH